MMAACCFGVLWIFCFLHHFPLTLAKTNTEKGTLCRLNLTRTRSVWILLPNSFVDGHILPLSSVCPSALFGDRVFSYWRFRVVVKCAVCCLGYCPWLTAWTRFKAVGLKRNDGLFQGRTRTVHNARIGTLLFERDKIMFTFSAELPSKSDKRV